MVRGRRVKTTPIVLDAKAQALTLPGQGDLHLLSVCMAGDIVQCFLQHR